MGGGGWRGGVGGGEGSRFSHVGGVRRGGEVRERAVVGSKRIFEGAQECVNFPTTFFWCCASEAYICFKRIV